MQPSPLSSSRTFTSSRKEIQYCFAPQCLPTAHPTPSPGKHECAFVSVDLPILHISYKGAVTYVLSVSNLFLLAKCVYFSLHSKNQYHFCPHNQVLDLTSSLNLCVSPLIPDI